jgi:hypothetical protein
MKRRAPLLTLAAAAPFLVPHSLLISDASVIAAGICMVVLVLILLAFAYVLISRSRVAPVIQLGDRIKLDFRNLDPTASKLAGDGGATGTDADVIDAAQKPGPCPELDSNQRPIP